MTILQKANYKRIGALAIGLAGLFATSAAGAHNPDGYGSDRGDRYGDDYGDDRGDRYGHDRGDRYGDKRQKEPRFTDNGDSLLAKAEIRDLHRGRDVKVELTGRAKVEIECRRKGGRGHGRGYGRDRDFKRDVWIDLEGLEHFSRREIRGNSLYIDIETDRARHELDRYWGGYGCSGRDWDRRIGEVWFESATLKVTQGGRTVVHWECEFDRLSRNGDIPRRDVKCYRHY
jgi:hypothetical protein